MTINHSIPHQQLLPNVTPLLIKIHPAARHFRGTNDLEIGFSIPESFPQDSSAPSRKGEGALSSSVVGMRGTEKPACIGARSLLGT